jgi:Importin-beta N-terminal domain
VRTQILEEVIKYRWGALPEEQREGIKNYISNMIIKLSTNEASFRREKVGSNEMPCTIFFDGGILPSHDRAPRLWSVAGAPQYGVALAARQRK